MQGFAGDGKENISQQDMVTPRVALMQAVSDEVTNGIAASGDFFHTVNEEVLGTAIDDLVVIHHSKRYTLWNPRHNGGGVLARASDGVNWDQPGEFTISPYKDRPKYTVTLTTGTKVGKDIGLGKWGSLDPENPDSPPAATLTHVLVCVSLSNMKVGPFVLLLQRAAEPVAKMLLSKIQLDQAPIYGQVYKMGSKIQSNSSQQDFNQYTFAKNGHVADEATFLELQKLHHVFKELGVKVDESAEQSEAERDLAARSGGGTDSKDDAGDKY